MNTIYFAQLKPAREQIEKIIRLLHTSLRKESVTFEEKLIGSGGKNLVTKVVGGNKGFDFDYNFVIQKDNGLEAKDLRLLFVRKLEDIIANTNYKSVSEGEQSFTIKVVDKKKSQIKHGCDFAIVNEINPYKYISHVLHVLANSKINELNLNELTPYNETVKFKFSMNNPQ